MTAPTQSPVVFVDRAGDVWRSGGPAPDGEELLVCDQPQGVDDIGGPGPTYFPWTRRTVEMWFGPLVPQAVERDFVDLEQAAIAEADRKFGDVHGPAPKWSPQEEVQYVRLITRVHHVFHPKAPAGNEVAA
jgi:hypothetical protein